MEVGVGLEVCVTLVDVLGPVWIFPIPASSVYVDPHLPLTTSALNYFPI